MLLVSFCFILVIITSIGSVSFTDRIGFAKPSMVTLDFVAVIVRTSDISIYPTSFLLPS